MNNKTCRDAIFCVSRVFSVPHIFCVSRVYYASPLFSLPLVPMGIFILILFFSSCKEKPHAINHLENKVYYTCTMHTQIHKEQSGDCPVCGMKLVKVELTGNGMTENKITLTSAQVQLASIRTDTVKEQSIGSEKLLPGIVTTDENKAGELSARVAGRIQQLFVRAPGEKIVARQPVYAVYSDDLQQTEKEYLLALQQQKQLQNPDVDYRQLVSAAENKLLLWGLTSAQIKALAFSGKVSPTVTIFSKVNGTVSDIAVHEGDYITEGMTILKIQDLDNLWVEAQLYPNESNDYKKGVIVSVSFPDLDNLIITGKVEFINPELSESSKVDLVRVSIANKAGTIKPGMLAYVSATTAGDRVLAIPVSAVLQDGKGSKVWVKNSDGSFSWRVIKTGAGNSEFIQVLSGLEAGEIVVSNGAYFLNSEYVFKNGDDKTGMGNMKM